MQPATCNLQLSKGLRSKALDTPFIAAERFNPPGKITTIKAYGNGNVHDTFLVTLDSKTEKYFILQRLNPRVFRRPELVMQNIRILTEHVRRRLQDVPLNSGRRWEIPRPLLTEEGRDLWVDPQGSFWRASSFINNARSYDTLRHAGHAREVGFALALFHNLINDLPSSRLADTLEGFHITPRYLQHYDRVLTVTHPKKSPEVNYGFRFVNRRRAWADVLEKARDQGRLHLRPIHGDPKVNNVLIDPSTQQAVSLVDLDTVKPGLIHYDIGDCLRSGCNPLGEETGQWESVRFALEYCRAMLQGYLPMARAFLLENDYDFLFEAVRLIAFELGLRFFTDYLEGNVYFKAASEEHNLIRALVQFKLTESIEDQSSDIQALIKDLR